MYRSSGAWSPEEHYQLIMVVIPDLFSCQIIASYQNIKARKTQFERDKNKSILFNDIYDTNKSLIMKPPHDLYQRHKLRHSIILVCLPCGGRGLRGD